MTEENSSISDNQLDFMLAELKKDNTEKENKIMNMCEYSSVDNICQQTTLGGKQPSKCSDVNSCFIKDLYLQLACKEQECEELKKQNDKLQQKLDEANSVIDTAKELICKGNECDLCREYDCGLSKALKEIEEN